MLRTLALAALVVSTAACDRTTPTSLEAADAPLFSAATGPAGDATYEVTITNLTDGQPLTPPLAVTHRQAIDLFTPGEPAGEAIQQIAENGNLAPMLAALDGATHVADVVVAAGDPLPPLLPGETRAFQVQTERGAKWLSFVSMLICTNDGFAGLRSARLPRDVGDVVMHDVGAYDAGTELNTESFDDLVPPCGPLTGIDTGGAGTGTSDPALAEGGVVRSHPGVMGDADLLSAIHGWSDPVAHVQITRIQ